MSPPANATGAAPSQAGSGVRAPAHLFADSIVGPRARRICSSAKMSHETGWPSERANQTESGTFGGASNFRSNLRLEGSGGPPSRDLGAAPESP